MVKVVCWNTNHQKEPWRWLHKMDADVALVQEACDPPSDARDRVDIGPKEHWDAAVWNSEWWNGRFPKLSDRQTMVVKLSDRVRIEWFKQVGPVSTIQGAGPRRGRQSVAVGGRVGREDAAGDLRPG